MEVRCKIADETQRPSVQRLASRPALCFNVCSKIENVLVGGGVDAFRVYPTNFNPPLL